MQKQTQTFAVARVVVVAAVGTMVACAPVDDVDVDEDDGCGPNASFNADHGHCDCDDGFEKQGTACLPVDDDEDEQDPAEVAAIDLSAAEITGQSATDDSGNAVYIVQAVAGDVVVRIEGYVGAGAPSTAASITLAGDELNYATCSVCVLAQTGCAAHDDHFHCEETLMATGGVVELDALDPAASIAGHLHDVQLVPVTIADDYQSTPVDGGQPHSIAHWEFATTLVAD